MFIGAVQSLTADRSNKDASSTTNIAKRGFPWASGFYQFNMTEFEVMFLTLRFFGTPRVPKNEEIANIFIIDERKTG